MEIALCPLLSNYSEDTVKLPVESIGLQVLFFPLPNELNPF